MKIIIILIISGSVAIYFAIISYVREVNEHLK